MKQDNIDRKLQNTGPEPIPAFPIPITIGEVRANILTEVNKKVRISN